MEGLEGCIKQKVVNWISEIQERSPEPGEVDAITAAVTRLADDFIDTQILNATS